MKKVISYSLWGDNPKYVQGAIENIKCQKQFYPDWVCRFYVHKDIPNYVYNRLTLDGAEVIDVDENPTISHMNAPGMFWRFDVLNDSTIDMCIIRDCDSRLSQREKNCIIDWEHSKKEFHIIRDHPHHSTRIMGGMWGCKKSFIDRIDYKNLKSQFDKLSYTNNYGSDQEFLTRMIYPLIKDNVCIHDDYHFFPDEKVRIIPHLKTNNDFIGKPIEIKI